MNRQRSEQAVAEERIRAAVLSGRVGDAVTELLRTFGPEVLGFLRGILGEADAEDAFAATSERVWRSLAAFRWQCALRTWVYVIARHEAMRSLKGERRREVGRVTSSELENVAAEVRSTVSAFRSRKRTKVQALRDELPVDDRTLLILRVDRDLAWEEVARAFLPDAESPEAAEIGREAARLRKRFQLVKRRLTDRAREEGLLPQ